jgi:tetratricopeptide (TPR) repeat protein
MDDDSRDQGPEDSTTTAIDTAQAELEVARETARVSSIALAHAQLARVLANSGFHADAVAEYEELLSYLKLASSDRQQDGEHWIRKASPGASQPEADQVDLKRLEIVARLNQVESLLTLGERADARVRLHAVAPMCRGLQRKPFRKKFRELEGRLSSENVPAASAQQGTAREQGPHSSATARQSDLSIAERLAEADAALARGEAEQAARNALQIVVDCGEDDHSRAQARQVLGMALETVGKHDEALTVMRLSFTDYLSAEMYAQAATLAIPIALRLQAKGQRTEAISLLRRCLTATEGSLPASVRARLMTDLGSLVDQEGDPIDAQRLLEAAAQFAEDPETAADAGHGLAVSLANDLAGTTDNRVEALSLLDSAKIKYTELGYLERAGGCDHEAAAVLGRLKSYPAALARYQKALATYQALTNPAEASELSESETADCTRNISAIETNNLSGPGLFASGGHIMSHPSAAEIDNPVDGESR